MNHVFGLWILLLVIMSVRVGGEGLNGWIDGMEGFGGRIWWMDLADGLVETTKERRERSRTECYVIITFHRERYGSRIRQSLERKPHLWIQYSL